MKLTLATARRGIVWSVSVATMVVSLLLVQGGGVRAQSPSPSPSGTPSPTGSPSPSATSTASPTPSPSPTPYLIVVDDNPIQRCAEGAQNHSTIQQGVDAAEARMPDSSDDVTVRVCPGVYREYVLVEAPMTIEGAQAGNDARDRRLVTDSAGLADESFVTPPLQNTPPPAGSEAAFFLRTDDVVLDGFYIGGFGDLPVSAAPGAGIYAPGTSAEHVIENNVITDSDIGIYLNGSDQTAVHNFLAENNAGGAASGNGIYSDQGLATSLIHENGFESNANSGVILLGSGSAAVSDVDISSNNFDANGASVLLVRTSGTDIRNNVSESSTGSGVYLGGDNSSTSIIGNAISDATSGINLATLYATSAGNAGTFIQDNTLTNNTNGLRARYDDPDTPANLAGGPQTTVLNNRFTENENGLNIDAQSMPGSVIAENQILANEAAGLRITAGPSDPLFLANRIFGNGIGVQNDSPNRTFIATNNWWGCNEGPSKPDCDHASARVTTSPWIVMSVYAASASVPAQQSTLITADLTKNSSGALASATYFLPEDTLVTFTTTEGSLSQTIVPLGNDGKATTTLRNNGDDGTAVVTAHLDNEQQSTQVQLLAPGATPSPSASTSPSPGSSPGATPSTSPSASPSTSPQPPPKCPEDRDRSGNHIVGTAGGDQLTGTEGDDVICGLGGDDAIDGRGGADFIYGGDGNDSIAGGAGDDSIEGGDGKDEIRGGDNDDLLLGGDQNDTLYGNNGRDYLAGQNGFDVLRGGGDPDEVYGGSGRDTLHGFTGRDLLQGGGGDDILKAGGGDDTARGGKSDDTISGGPGSDRIRGGRGDDTCAPGTGRDDVRGCEH